MGIGPHDGRLLSIFGMELRRAFGHTAYQVGSSLTEKKGWRDVDVRLMLPRSEYISYFSDPETKYHKALRLMSWNLAWTMLGRSTTRLPIDFQFQDVELANEQYPGPRGALLILPGEMEEVQDESR